MNPSITQFSISSPPSSEIIYFKKDITHNYLIINASVKDDVAIILLKKYKPLDIFVVKINHSNTNHNCIALYYLILPNKYVIIIESINIVKTKPNNTKLINKI